LNTTLPEYVKKVEGEVQADYWRPQTLDEWTSTVIVNTWSDQQTAERPMRRCIAIWIFILMSLQVVMVLGIMVASAAQWISPDVQLFKLLIPAVLAEVFGMGWAVVKYLFKPVDVNLLGLLKAPTNKRRKDGN